MSTNKTLADVQPGGRVRLQQALPPEGYAGAWIRSAYGQPSSFTYWNMEVAYAAGWQDALAAQPSPGGQDALVTDAMVYAAEEAYANSKPDNLHESFRAAIAAALAARQPVGEPVCFIHPRDADKLRVKEFSLRQVDTYWSRISDSIPVYLGQPAQAVGLGELPRAVELLSNVARTLVDWAADEQREAIGIVKALIDSHVAGK